MDNQEKNTDVIDQVMPGQSPAPVDAVVKVHKSEDLMAAYVIISPPQYGGKDLTFEQIMQCLFENKVIYGLQSDVIRQLAEQPRYNVHVKVAKGLEPVNGEDAVLTYHFDTSNKLKPKERPDGTVDFQNLGLVKNVYKGQLLCTLKRETEGIAGYRVDGTQIKPIPGKHLNLPIGANTYASEDNLNLYAAVNGHVSLQKNTVNVNSVFRVRGNVDNSTGNIDCSGDVIVDGDILAGFSVKASGNVEVFGLVEGAHIVAGSDIKLRNGFNGNGKGVVECKGNFYAKYVENATVICEGDIMAEHMINCTVSCKGNLTLVGARAALVGGTYMINKNLTAKTIGSVSNIMTTIEIGADPSLYMRQKEVYQDIKDCEKKIASLTRLNELFSQLESVGRLDKEKAQIYENSKYSLKVAKLKLENLQNEQARIAEEIDSLRNGQIVCRECIYPGVRISIGSVKMIVTRPEPRCRLFLRNDTIQKGTV